MDRLRRMSVRAQARLLLLVLSTLLSVLVAEGLLRALDVGPWRPFAALADVPVLTTPHPTIGWVNRPGTYRYRPSPQAPDPVRVTIDAEARRQVTGPDRGRVVDLYGGSFIFGFGLDDSEVVSARLAVARPDLQIRNHAVPGYGTVQARLLSATQPTPDVVVYGLVELHDARNVAARTWLHGLERAGSHHPWHGVPWAVWDGRALHEHPPASWRHWPLSEWSAVVHLVERASLDLRDRTLNTKTETTVQTVLRWRDEVMPARFVVALLHAPSRHRAYLRRFSEEGVEVIDLREHGYPEHTVPGDGHPAALVHQRWADTLSGAL